MYKCIDIISSAETESNKAIYGLLPCMVSRAFRISEGEKHVRAG